MFIFENSEWNSEIKKNNRALHLESQLLQLLQRNYSDEELVQQFRTFDKLQKPYLFNTYALLVMKYANDPSHYYTSKYIDNLVYKLKELERNYCKSLQRFEATNPNHYKQTIICIKARIENLQKYLSWINNPTLPYLVPRYDHWFNKAMHNEPEPEKHLTSAIQATETMDNTGKENLMAINSAHQEFVDTAIYNEVNITASNENTVEKAQMGAPATAGMSNVDNGKEESRLKRLLQPDQSVNTPQPKKRTRKSPTKDATKTVTKPRSRASSTTVKEKPEQTVSRSKISNKGESMDDDKVQRDKSATPKGKNSRKALH